MFIARLLFKEKSLRFYNWEYPNRGQSSSSWGPVATLIYRLGQKVLKAESLPGRIAAERGGRSRYQRRWY